MDEHTDLVTTAEAAEILGRPLATINRWASEGRLPRAAKLPGRTGANLYRRSDVEALASERRAG
jgi:excisionase family DNA binding protein